MKQKVFRIFIAFLLLFTISNLLQKASGKPIPMTLGFGTAVVASGSMEPEIPIGSLIVIHKQDQYEVGDIVTIQRETKSTVTHRIIAIDNDTFTTKGDANNAPDRSPVSHTDILGKVILTMPGAGAFLYMMLALFMIITPLGLLLFLCFNTISKKRKSAS